MSRESERDAYFNKPSMAAALKAANEALSDRTRWKQELRDVRMRAMALALLMRFISTEEWTAGDIAVALRPGQESTASDGARGKAIDRERSELAAWVQPLLSPNREKAPTEYKGFDQAKLIDLLALSAAQALQSAHLIGSEQTAAILTAARIETSSLDELFSALIKAAGIDRDSYPVVRPKTRTGSKERPLHQKRVLHSIPPDILNYLPGPFGQDDKLAAIRNSEDIQAKAKEVRDLLGARSQKRRIIALVGNINAGKTGTLVELLRSLCRERSQERSKSVVLQVDDSQGGAILPVMVLDTQKLTDRSLMSAIHDYLSFLAGGARSKKSKRGEGSMVLRDTDRTVDQLKEISDLHRGQPVFFVFLDWQVFSADSVRSLLRRDARARILETLHRSNSRSRFLIISAGTIREDRPLDLPPIKYIHMDDPLFGEIKRYLPDLKYPEDSRVKLQSCERLRRLKRIPGEVLLAMAAALELSAGESLETEDTLAAIEKFCRSEAQREGPEVDAIFRIIIRRLQEENLLRPLLVIASSEDGVRTDSLRQILEAWDAHDPFEEGFHWKIVLQGLSRIGELGNGFFLKHAPDKEPDDEEFDIAEHPPETELLWEVRAPLAAHIQTAIVGWPGPKKASVALLKLMRESRRQLASFARRRGQTKRMRSVSWVRPPGIDHLKRDVQTYTALLASINPDGIVSDPPLAGTSPLLRMSDDAVFSDVAHFRPGLALRYALKCILRKDIDDAHDLTMVYDHDPMRLRLYLLLFFPLGRQHIWSVDDLVLEPGHEASLPDQVPHHLTLCFRRPEIMRLLATVAITAYHCQNPNVVVWARLRAEELISSAPTETERLELFFHGVRVWCSYIDIAVQNGKLPPTSALPEQGHAGTLSYVDQLVERHFADLEHQEQGDFSFDGGAKSKLTAWMRLKARQAELHAITGGNTSEVADLGRLRKAGEIYAIIERMEHKIASIDGNEDPVVFSGRTGRRYIRYLLKPRAVATASRSKDATIRALIEVNKARLRRFGGADQIAVYLDEARYRRFARPDDLEQPTSLAILALNLCDQGFASHGIRLETLILLSELELASASNLVGRDDDREGALKTILAVQDRLDLVLKMAEGLGFWPSLAQARILKARCLLLRHHLEQDNNKLVIEADELLAMAVQTLEACADHSLDDDVHKLRSDFPTLNNPFVQAR